MLHTLQDAALLDKALDAAGIASRQIYIINAVKDFKRELRGERRLHNTPTPREIDACNPWLREELAPITPCNIVCLGVTARVVFGKLLAVRVCRGRLAASAYSARTLVTAHPSSGLRLRESTERAETFNQSRSQIFGHPDKW